MNAGGAGDTGDWLTCASADSYGLPYGCGYTVIDFAVNNFWEYSENICTILPLDPPVIQPTRTYQIELDVTSNFGFGGSEDVMGVIIRGTEGNETALHNISAPNSNTDYVFDIFDETDVGHIQSIHIVTFGADDLCFDRVVIDGSWIWDNSCLFCSSYCVGYNSWQTSGCGIVDIDFWEGVAEEIEEIPCSILPRTGSVFEDSWFVGKINDLLDDWGLSQGNATGTNNNHTGPAEESLELSEWSKTLSYEVIPGLDIAATIKVQHNIRVDCTFSWGSVTSFDIGLDYEAGLILDVTLALSKDLVDIDKSIFDLILWTFGLNLYVVSLGVSVGIDLRAGALVNVEANLHCFLSYNVFGDVGLEMTTDSEYIPYANMDKDYQFDCDEFNAGITAQIFVYPIFFCRIDYVFSSTNLIDAVVKPYIEASITFDGLVEISEPGACYLSIAANYGLQIVIRSHIVTYSWTLYNEKWPIFEGCLDELLSIALSELAQLVPGTVLGLGTGNNLCSTSYGASTRSQNIVSESNVCSATSLKQVFDVTQGVYNLFGKVDALWNGRIYPISLTSALSASLDEFDRALRDMQYENYQVKKVKKDLDSVELVVVFNSIIPNYLGRGIPLNCFYTLLQNVNGTRSVESGISKGITNKECILSNRHNNITGEAIEGDIVFWVISFHEMNARLARRELFAEFIIKKPFKTNANFVELQFDQDDNRKVFYGGIWCNVCNIATPSSCGQAIKSFELTIYSNGQKARLQTNYMEWPISDLDVTFDNVTSITCIGTVLCGKMAVTTENYGNLNRYYFGEVINVCYANRFCGTDNQINNDILPLFVFNELADEAYNDTLYEWEGTSIVADSNIYDECNGDQSNVFTYSPTTSEPTTSEPTTAEPTTGEPTTVEPTSPQTTGEPGDTSTTIAIMASGDVGNFSTQIMMQSFQTFIVFIIISFVFSA